MWYEMFGPFISPYHVLFIRWKKAKLGMQSMKSKNENVLFYKNALMFYNEKTETF
jgi:hypothetical protein